MPEHGDTAVDVLREDVGAELWLPTGPSSQQLMALAGTWLGLRARTLFGLTNPRPTDSVC